MKLTFVILILLVGVCSAEYSKQELKRILSAAKSCKAQLSIPPEDDDIVERGMYNRDISGDAITKKYIKCVMITMGLIDADGTIRKQNIVDCFKDNYPVELLEKVIDFCDKPNESDTVDDKIYRFYKCVFKNKGFEI